MNYRKLNNGIAAVLSPAECYTYFCLTLKSDYETLESNVKQETLAKYVGVSTSTIQRHLAKMYDEGFIWIDRETHKDNENIFKKNHYTLLYDISIYDDDGFAHWVMVDEKLVREPISNELKGFLIMLKIRCLNYTNTCGYSVRRLADTLSIGKSMVDRYLQQAEELGYIKRNKKKKNIELLRDDIFIIARETDIHKLRSFCEEAVCDDDYDSKGHYISSEGTTETLSYRR
jgi:DNA-binding MarR family transcriptional regulator